MAETVMECISYSPHMAGKDAAPLDTVERIKKLLEENGIETEEKWGTSDVPYCYSLRIDIKGTSIGANGKGITREFALASGYGELIERMQLGLIWRNKLQIEGGASSCEAQSCLMPVNVLLESNPQRYDIYAKELKETTGVSVTGKELLLKYANSQGFVQATAFYNLRTQSVEYLPTALCKSVYVTSGGAAGNTMEEAMVQAFSEIVERRHKLRVVHEDHALPDIPEEVLRSSAIAYEIITFLRSNGYRVLVKDCSLGTDFPVVCVCLIDVNTGKYHTHFGAYPDFDIALQRTLTESFQGRNLRSVAKHENFFFKDELRDLRYLLVELVKGTSEKSPRFFLHAPSQSGTGRKEPFGATNQERLKGCIAFFLEQGCDILVRDSSSLGFPTCQIIIPGYSEVLPQRMSEEYNDNRYSAYASRVLRNPVSAKLDDLMGLVLHISQSKRLKTDGLECFTTESGLPANLSSQEETYLLSTAMAYVSYTLGRYKDVITYLSHAISQSADTEYLICIKRYVALRINKYTTEDIIAILRQFHKPETVDLLFSCIAEKKNPLTHIVLQCDMHCSEKCALFGRCKKSYSDALVKLITEKAAGIDQSAVQSLLRSYL